MDRLRIGLQKWSLGAQGLDRLYLDREVVNYRVTNMVPIYDTLLIDQCCSDETLNHCESYCVRTNINSAFLSLSTLVFRCDNASWYKAHSNEHAIVTETRHRRLLDDASWDIYQLYAACEVPNHDTILYDALVLLLPILHAISAQPQIPR